MFVIRVKCTYCCAANISSISVCLACEQAEKISKLEKAMREKDIEIKMMKDIISKLQQKMEEADRTEREADQVNNYQGRKCWL